MVLTAPPPPPPPRAHPDKLPSSRFHQLLSNEGVDIDLPSLQRVRTYFDSIDTIKGQKFVSKHHHLRRSVSFWNDQDAPLQAEVVKAYAAAHDWVYTKTGDSYGTLLDRARLAHTANSVRKWQQALALYALGAKHEHVLGEPEDLLEHQFPPREDHCLPAVAAAYERAEARNQHYYKVSEFTYAPLRDPTLEDIQSISADILLENAKNLNHWRSKAEDLNAQYHLMLAKAINIDYSPFDKAARPADWPASLCDKIEQWDCTGIIL